MVKPDKHIREEERLKLLESYSILDTLPEVDYDNLTLIASQICGTPIALITFLDGERQWFKSKRGLDAAQTPKDFSFCGHAINSSENVFMVPDAMKDARFHDNPLVIGEPNVIFYAGVTLVNDKGLPLGTICVIDNKPNELNPQQIEALQALSKQTMNVLDLRLNKLKLEKTLLELQKKNEELERFAYIAAHDLKSPLANIAGLTDHFLDSFGAAINDEGREVIELIKSSAAKLREMIDSLMVYSKSGIIEQESSSVVVINELENEFKNLFAFHTNCTIQFKSDLISIETNKTALDQILINLISNAIKYNDKEHIDVTIVIRAAEQQYTFVVSDNGPGILEKDQDVIFDPFTVASDEDRFGLKGNGIGLSIVQKMVEAMGGTIHVASKMGSGTTFSFNLKQLM